eukprot:3799101-Pyramimonas_sp.AAC.1
MRCAPSLSSPCVGPTPRPIGKHSAVQAPGRTRFPNTFSALVYGFWHQTRIGAIQARGQDEKGTGHSTSNSCKLPASKIRHRAQRHDLECPEVLSALSHQS